VVLILAPEAQQALTDWEPVNSHYITAKFTTKKEVTLNSILCYPPTNDAEEKKKNYFYCQPQAVIDKRGAKDMTILMAEFNAKIGADNTGYEDIMGTLGLRQMNEKCFVDLCALNQLVIRGSILQQGHVEICRPCHGETDRPYLHQP
jgi:hypothetical protein